MEKFEAEFVGDKAIVLKSSNDIERIYKLLNDNENFILEWTSNIDGKKEILQSELKIATNLLGKIKAGDLVLSALTRGGERK